MASIKDLLIESNSDKQSAHRYGFVYDLLFTKVFQQKGSGLRVLEIGVSEYGDGSLKAYADSEMVASAVGIDVLPYRGEVSDNMRVHELDAYSKETVSYLKEIEGSFDIIIDDGTNREEDQAFFLENYDQLLSDTGFLICEDVSALNLIKSQCEREDVFFFDGWGNREVGFRSFTDSNLFSHAERMLIKSKSEKLTDAKRHENKVHISKLPIVKVQDYERRSTELAVSVPLFHPELDSYNSVQFQEIHCKGAIWAGLSMIQNSDLGDNGVPLYFHIEDKVWHDAMPVFEDFNVPLAWCRKMTIPEKKVKSDLKVTSKPSFGKSWMGLSDETIDTDIMMILDSDFFTCTTDKKFRLYDKLTSPILKNQPSMTYFQLRDLPYWWWVSIVLLASGLPDKLMYKQPIDKLEQEAYKRLGFEKDVREDVKPNDTVNAFFAEDYLMTFPRSHPARDFAIANMPGCYATPYLFSMWAEYNQPFLELNQILKIPVYDWEKDFIEGKHGYDCFSHIRAEKLASGKLTAPSRIREYWDTFFENVSRYVQ